MENIRLVARKLNLNEEDLFCYGNYKAKIEKINTNRNGKLILVTSTNPTPYGEGKTTLSIGLCDSLNKLGYISVADLREPSLGPVFGRKGGAVGGGKAIIEPSMDINLHFNGDFHAITSANNLICAAVDNHIFQGNELKIDKVLIKRCIDMNDRSLRDNFVITPASEIMAILCLSKDINDLKERIGNIIVGITRDDKEIYAKDLHVENACILLLKDAIKPNLVQTLYNNPVIVHGGPFANIAHGCNSIVATNIAMSLGDITITEAGFGADLGAEKFLDIKCRNINTHPDAVVLVATIRSLKYHGGMPKEDIAKESIDYLEKGMNNLYKHIHNLKEVYGLNVVVAINRFSADTNKEISFLEEKLNKIDVDYAVTDGYSLGSDGSIELARKVLDNINKPNNFNYAYDINDSIKEKIYKVSAKIYGAKDVEYSDVALEKLSLLEEKYNNVPICIAKTQYSLSDDPKNLDPKKDYNIHVTDLVLKSGAEFIVVLTGDIMTMPGLPKVPNSENIDIIDDVTIGIF